MNGFVDRNWYVLADDLSYGPYSQDTMISFVNEGRVIQASLVSTDAQRNFVAAGTLPIFQKWVSLAQATRGQQNEQPQDRLAQHSYINTQQPSTAHTYQAQGKPQGYTQGHHPQGQTQDQGQGQDTLYIVMAEIDAKTGMNFLRTLQSVGYVQRIGDSVWLLRAPQNLSEVKNALSINLSKRDRLFIHDCFANKQAWENIGGDLDQRIRSIWQTIQR